MSGGTRGIAWRGGSLRNKDILAESPSVKKKRNTDKRRYQAALKETEGASTKLKALINEWSHPPPDLTD